MNTDQNINIATPAPFSSFINIPVYNRRPPSFFPLRYEVALAISRSGTYIGMIIFSISIATAVTYHGWLRGLQMTTMICGVNVLLGQFYYQPASYRR